jgi:alkanesulfonate monooxygenase SsuD/methylene tetrahydromethanopterin reductase-like flavin-dependent oxidoreductase (luciferase family)
VADGWVTSSRANLSRIGESIEVVRSAAQEAGRDPGTIRIICRGVVRTGDEAGSGEGSSGEGSSGEGSSREGSSREGGRRLLSGSYDQIRADTAWLASQGVTEVFYDLNWDPQIGSPEADPASAVQRAGEILDALAPGQ